MTYWEQSSVIAHTEPERNFNSLLIWQSLWFHKSINRMTQMCQLVGSELPSFIYRDPDPNFQKLFLKIGSPKPTKNIVLIFKK